MENRPFNDTSYEQYLNEAQDHGLAVQEMRRPGPAPPADLRVLLRQRNGMVGIQRPGETGRLHQHRGGPPFHGQGGVRPEQPLSRGGGGTGRRGQSPWPGSPEWMPRNRSRSRWERRSRPILSPREKGRPGRPPWSLNPEPGGGTSLFPQRGDFIFSIRVGRTCRKSATTP